MLPAAHLERTERPGRGHPHLADVVDDRCGRPGCGAARAGRPGDRAGPRRRSWTEPSLVFATQPSRPEVHRLAQHEIAEADALHPSADGRIEPRGWCFGEQRSAVRRPRCATARRGPAHRARARARRSRPAAPPIARRGPGTPRPIRAGWRPRSRSVRRAAPCHGPNGRRPSRPARGRGRRPPTGRAGSRRHVAARRPGSWRDRPPRRWTRRGRRRAGRRPEPGRKREPSWPPPPRPSPARRSCRRGHGIARTESAGQGDRARDRGPGCGQAGGRTGIGEVEQDTRELGADEDRRGGSGVGQRKTRTATREPAKTRGGRRIGQAMVGEDGLDVASADEPQAEPEAARSDGRQETRLLVSAEQDRDTGRWLLEGLEQGRLGILVHPIGALDDGDTGTALDRHEQQLADQILDPAVLRVRATDDDLATRSGRPETVEVGVAAVLDQPARPADAARPRIDCGGAQQPRRDVEREGRLADPFRARRGGRPGARDPGSSWPPRRARRPGPGSGRLP